MAESIISKLTPGRLFGPEMLANPYPVYHHLRTTDPVHWDADLKAWLLTRYKDVLAGLHDQRLSSERATLFQALVGKEDLKPFFAFLASRMIFCDGTKHTRLRGLLNKAFTPHVVQAMRPRIQELVDQLIDRVQHQGHMDVIRDLAFPLPATVISLMLGVPASNIGQLKKWSDEFVVFFSNAPGSITAEQYRRAAQAATAMSDFFGSALAQLRQSPQDSLLRAMEAAEQDGDRLSHQELIANANLLMVAGHETTTNLIGNGVLALLRNPDQLQMLLKQPDLIPQAVEELLRYCGPVQFTHRVALEDFELGGKHIQKGQWVFLMLAAANRDPDHFPDPDRLDIARESNHHVALGQGNHFCLGAPLARLEAQITFATLLKRFPGMNLACDDPAYGDNFNMHGLKALPISFAVA